MARRPKRPRRPMPDSAIERLIQALGGPTPASYVARVSVAALWKWRREGRVTHPKGMVRLWHAAQAVGLDITVDELAGLPYANGGNGDERAGDGGGVPIQSGESRGTARPTGVGRRRRRGTPRVLAQ